VKPQPSLTKLRDGAVDSAEAAGKILLKYFRGKIKVAEKKGAGLVTNADFEAQDKVVSVLRKATPNFGFLTEEAKPELSSSPGRWIIDPLDGTTNFVHGFPMFCVSIAAEWEGEIVVGVIYHPVLKDLYVAVRGKGATLNGRRISVSKTVDLHKALLTTGFVYRKEDRLKTEMDAFEQLSGVARAIRRPGSAALDLAYTACGVFDGFWERRLSPWDIAAGSLLVTEAGGQVTDFAGKSFQVETKELLASNPQLHPKLLRFTTR
jgi:myo-inositol-1(or 4)-monophosphatase